MAAVAKQRCQRIGCNATFTDDENFEDSCLFHPGPPLFHDGGKEWSCCKQKSHDFTMFLDLPGCTTGKHSSEKPQAQPKVAPMPKVSPIPVGVSGASATCPRCKQGFFCSDHGSKLPSTSIPSHPEKKAPVPTAAPRVLDLTAKQICKNEGCGQKFIEKENTDTSCQYHPGPPIFRDRQKGWACCDVHVKDFDEFLHIPPCTRGWHNANP